MKYNAFIFFIIILIVGCNSVDKELFGIWDVKNKFYSATYEILKEDKKIKAKVLYYNDGTTKIFSDKENVRYLFVDLEKKDSIYVDGITGATGKTDSEKSLSIKILDNDLLEVTQYHPNGTTTETWTRNLNY